jgi:hypothetical protein
MQAGLNLFGLSQDGFTIRTGWKQFGFLAKAVRLLG